MSLFKAREWWGTTIGPDESCDQGCMCVANINNAEDNLGIWYLFSTLFVMDLNLFRTYVVQRKGFFKKS